MGDKAAEKSKYGRVWIDLPGFFFSIVYACYWMNAVDDGFCDVFDQINGGQDDSMSLKNAKALKSFHNLVRFSNPAVPVLIECW